MRALFDSFGVPEFGLLFCRDPPTGNPVLQPRVDVIEKFPVDASEYQVPHHTFHLAVWKNSRGWISERNRTSCLVWIASSRLWFPRAFSNCTTLRIGSLHIFTAYAVHLTYFNITCSQPVLTTPVVEHQVPSWMNDDLYEAEQILKPGGCILKLKASATWFHQSCYRVTDSDCQSMLWVQILPLAPSWCSNFLNDMLP